MATTAYSTPGIHFGIKYPGKLPQGWELIESPEDWAIGKSPDGQEYFLAADKAYPRRYTENFKSKINPQGIWIDLNNGIIDL
jgi:hypothetical protein